MNEGWGNATHYFEYAKCLVKLGRTDEAIEKLNICVKYAYEFENRPDETKINSFLIGEKVVRKTDFETADSRPLHEIIRDKWLAEKEFDAIRNTKEFKGILEQLN